MKKLIIYILLLTVSFSYSQKEEFDVQCNNLIKFSKHEDINKIKKFNFQDKGRDFIRRASVYEALKLLLNALKR